jgi:hypothetical protein
MQTIRVRIGFSVPVTRLMSDPSRRVSDEDREQAVT